MNPARFDELAHQLSESREEFATAFKDAERSKEAIYLEELRTLLSSGVAETSLRTAARAIGMSPTGLKKFLTGSRPYTPTERRLRNWYLRFAAEKSEEVGMGEAQAALTLLMSGLSPDLRRETASCVLGCIARAYDGSGKPRPEWIAELARAVRAAPGADSPQDFGCDDGPVDVPSPTRR